MNYTFWGTRELIEELTRRDNAIADLKTAIKGNTEPDGKVLVQYIADELDNLN